MNREQHSASKARLDGAFLVAAGGALFVLLGCTWNTNPLLKMGDFKAVYYASEALLHHQDPYSDSNLLHIYAAAPENRTLLSHLPLPAVTMCVNLPTTVALLAPIALLPWSVAQVLWSVLIAASFLLAAYLIWEVGAEWAPRMSGVLVFLVLSGSQALLEVGNAAGIAVSLCILGAWCFIRGRFVAAGVVCLALSLVLKPQDAGFVWLFFLLAGGVHRRRALQTLAVVAALALFSLLWVGQVSPHWAEELHANLVSTSAPGQVNDPTPVVVEPGIHGAMTVSLQTVTAVFTREPALFNLLAYALCAPFILLWGFAALRTRPSIVRDWFALAAIVPISMLVCYHRQHDTRILLLAIPVCALFWAEGKTSGKLATITTVIALLASSNPLLQLFGVMTYHLRMVTTGISGEILTATVGRPVAVAMLAMGTFCCTLFAMKSSSAEARTAAAFSDAMERVLRQEEAAVETVGTR